MSAVTEWTQKTQKWENDSSRPYVTILETVGLIEHLWRACCEEYPKIYRVNDIPVRLPIGERRYLTWFKIQLRPLDL